MKRSYIEFLGNGQDDYENCRPSVIHLGGAACQADFTLCGITLDHDEFTAGHHKPVKKQPINCQACIQIIELCKGVKTAK